MQPLDPIPASVKFSAGRSFGTRNHIVWLLPDATVMFWPKPVQWAPFQPSPAPSLMRTVQFAPSAASEWPKKGAAPSSTDPPEHVILQLTSSGRVPADTVTGLPMAAAHGMSSMTRSRHPRGEDIRKAPVRMQSLGILKHVCIKISWCCLMRWLIFSRAACRMQAITSTSTKAAIAPSRSCIHCHLV